MKKRHRVIDPSKAAAAALGSSFYFHIPEPERQRCERCGEQRINVDKDGVCCYCKRPPRRKDQI